MKPLQTTEGTNLNLRSGNDDDSSSRFESNPHCTDGFDEWCPTWAKNGEFLVNPVFMLKTCQYSCWQCVNVHKDIELGVDESITIKKLIYSKMNAGMNQVVSRTSSSNDDDDDSDDDDEDSDQDLPTRNKIISMEQYLKHVIADPSIPNKTKQGRGV